MTRRLLVSLGFLVLLALWTVAFGAVWAMTLFIFTGGHIDSTAPPQSDLPFFAIVIGGFVIYGSVAFVIIRTWKRACFRKS